jgi:NAD(P)-dependent dehydrogenase (short-subunit alcohol dehydrogenase family)
VAPVSDGGRLEGARIVVTGASRGLGRALAEAFAAEGARLVLTATRVGHLDAVAARLRRDGSEVHALALELGDAGAARRVGFDAIAALGRVDVLVNNAGVLGERRPLAEYPIDAWKRVLEVNVTGVLGLTQAVLPGMPDGGAVINVTSGAAGRPGWGAYAISKLAIDGVTGILREELAPRGIRCVAINPGATRTAMRAAAYPAEDPDTVAAPSARVGPFVAVAAGADPGPHVEAAEWTGR